MPNVVHIAMPIPRKLHIIVRTRSKPHFRPARTVAVGVVERRMLELIVALWVRDDDVL